MVAAEVVASNCGEIIRLTWVSLGIVLGEENTVLFEVNDAGVDCNLGKVLEDMQTPVRSEHEMNSNCH